MRIELITIATVFGVTLFSYFLLFTYLFADCKFNCHKKCAPLVPKDCQGYSGYANTQCGKQSC